MFAGKRWRSVRNGFLIVAISWLLNPSNAYADFIKGVAKRSAENIAAELLIRYAKKKSKAFVDHFCTDGAFRKQWLDLAGVKRLLETYDKTQDEAENEILDRLGCPSGVRASLPGNQDGGGPSSRGSSQKIAVKPVNADAANEKAALLTRTKVLRNPVVANEITRSTVSTTAEKPPEINLVARPDQSLQKPESVPSASPTPEVSQRGLDVQVTCPYALAYVAFNGLEWGDDRRTLILQKGTVVRNAMPFSQDGRTEGNWWRGQVGPSTLFVDKTDIDGVGCIEERAEALRRQQEIMRPARLPEPPAVAEAPRQNGYPSQRANRSDGGSYRAPGAPSRNVLGPPRCDNVLGGLVNVCNF